jgi:hypothetical protein
MSIEIDPSLPHYDVRVFLCEDAAGPERDARVAELIGLPVGPAYTTDLNAICGALNARGYWWHLSHLQATVTPNKPAPGMEGLMSNAAMYDREGNTMDYTSHFAGDNPAWALCEAWIMAVFDLPVALAVNASHSEEVLSREPPSREHMMAYYEATEEYRQDAIARYNSEPAA